MPWALVTRDTLEPFNTFVVRPAMSRRALGALGPPSRSVGNADGAMARGSLTLDGPLRQPRLHDAHQLLLISDAHLCHAWGVVQRWQRGQVGRGWRRVRGNWPDSCNRSRAATSRGRARRTTAPHDCACPHRRRARTLHKRAAVEALLDGQVVAAQGVQQVADALAVDLNHRQPHLRM